MELDLTRSHMLTNDHWLNLECSIHFLRQVSGIYSTTPSQIECQTLPMWSYEVDPCSVGNCKNVNKVMVKKLFYKTSGDLNLWHSNRFWHRQIDGPLAGPVTQVRTQYYVTVSVAATKLSSKGKFEKFHPGRVKFWLNFCENIICDSYHIGLIILLAHNWTYRR